MVFSRSGSDKPGIAYGKARQLVKMNHGEGPHVLIVPGFLHPVEKEMLEMHCPRGKRKA
jgi:diphthamide biosynthesis methyltransferase